MYGQPLCLNFIDYESKYIIGINLKSKIVSVEQFYIQQALDLTNGVVAQAAKLLGLRRTTLVEKLKKHQLSGSTTS